MSEPTAAYADPGLDPQAAKEAGPAGYPPAGRPSGAPKRLMRRTDDRVIAGVASGFGEYFDVDPILFRVGFVVAVFLGGVGLVAYGLCWWLMPVAPTPGGAAVTDRAESMRRRADEFAHSLRQSPSWLGVLLLVVGVALVASQIRVWRPDVVWGIALIALGILLFRRGAGARGTAPAEPEPSAQAGGPGMTLPVTATVPEATAAAPAMPLPPGASAAPAPVRRRREPATLAWISLGAALLASGAAALLNASGATHLAPVQFPALALAVLGLGLLVGTWWGRSRWLILPGALLVPFVLAASLIHVPFTGGFGERVAHPVEAAAVQPSYRLVAGRLTLDLRDLPPGSEPVPIRATAVAGQIRVFVPSDTVVTVHARSSAGEVRLFGQSFDGPSVDVRRTLSPPGAAGEIQLDLETSFGQVEVQR